MSQSIESQISDKDGRWINTYHLGHPLKIYRPSSRYVRFESLSGLIIALLAWPLSIVLVLTEKGASWSTSLPVYLSGVFLFFIGVIGLTVMLDTRKLHLIVCETGLLEVTSLFGYRHARIIYWENVKTLQKWFFDEYRLKGGKGQSIAISTFIYQNGEELLTFVRERIAERQS